MSKLLTLSKHWIASKLSSCLHCYIIFWTCRAFSHFTFYVYHLRYYIIIDHRWKLLTLNHVIFTLNSNEWIKVAHLQKLANQSMLNGALVIEMIKKQKKLWSFDKMKEVLIKKKKKIEIWTVKNIFLLDFAKYLSY